jgi:hypothetical protein
MDFVLDLKTIALDVLISYGVDYSKAKSDREIVEMFVNVQLKLIRPIPRKVLKSKTLLSRSLSDDTNNVLTAIEKKFQEGEDVNPHLSKNVFKGKHIDYLFADWRIYHLHLNTVADGSYFVERSQDVLFLTIFKDVVYFIDVRPHGPNGEKHVFAQKELLQIINDEWPQVLEPKLKGVIGLEREVNDPAEISALRKAGINTLHGINGSFYAPMGGGITSARTAVNVTRETDNLYDLARDATEFVKNNRPALDGALFQKNKTYDAKAARFRLLLNGEGFILLEESTRTVILTNGHVSPLLSY